MVQIDQVAIGHILTSSTDEEQIICCIEELSELQKELCKALRHEGRIDAILEETADVLFTVEQMKLIFGLRDSEISRMISYKAGRTLARFRNKKEGNEK